MPTLNTERLARRIELLVRARKEHTLRGIRRGIEKESLRVTPNGHIAQTPHPAALGAALTHPHVTTDYSEALLEFITPAYEHVTDCLLFLADTHHFVYANLGDECLWVNSMPCIVGDELSIPIADYGRSNIGRFKTTYRHGLWHRYGRHMQAIAGIHYNLSFPDNFWWNYQRLENGCGVALEEFTSREYFALIRNFQKFLWLAVYLTGASPALCASFMRGREHTLERTENHSLYRPYATSLRMSDLGYSNATQAQLEVGYNSLTEYVDSLDRAIATPYAPYEKIGLGDESGQWNQLNTHLLQMEAEFYGSIRPKCVPLPGERTAVALRSRGVEYVEMRCLDLNPWVPVGIDYGTAYFMDLFATFCLLHDSPLQTPADIVRNKVNLRTAVNEGRNPEATIDLDGNRDTLRAWGLALCDAMQPVARLLDDARQTHSYTRTLADQRRKLMDPELTPSARVLNELRDREISFFEFAMGRAQATRDYFRGQSLSPERREFFRRLAADSLEEQREIEAGNGQPFADYVAAFYR